MDLLSKPDSYTAADRADIERVTNGCGPGGWRVDLIPDHLGDVDISEPCRIHDWEYSFGGSEEDRLKADVRLYVNVAGNVLLNDSYAVPLQMAAAVIFYRAVREAGAAFWGVK